MARPSLDDLTADLDRVTTDLLGETILYAADGSTYAGVKAFVNYRDSEKQFEAAEAISQDMTVSGVLKVDVPTKPTTAARITLPRRSGKTYRPSNVRTDDEGTGWEFELKAV